MLMKAIYFNFSNNTEKKIYEIVATAVEIYNSSDVLQKVIFLGCETDKLTFNLFNHKNKFSCLGKYHSFEGSKH